MYTKSFCEGIVKDRQDQIDIVISKVKSNYSQMNFENMNDKDDFKETVINQIVKELNDFKDELDSISFE